MGAGGRLEMQNGAKNAKRGQGMLMRLERETPRHENAASSSFGPVQTRSSELEERNNCRSLAHGEEAQGESDGCGQVGVGGLVGFHDCFLS